MRFSPRLRPSGRWRPGYAPLLVLPLLLAGCQDHPLPVQPADDSAAAVSVVPAALRTAKGDLITGDAAEFAQALKETGADGEVLVWIKETGTSSPAPQFFLDLPTSGKETIALPAETPGAQHRRTLGPPSARGASVDAVVRALEKAGATSVKRMQALPVIVVRLPEDVRLGALQALLRNRNVDYVSAVRAGPARLTAAPVGTNPIDAKHTVHKIDQVWNLTRGAGVKVGILDTGFSRNNFGGGYHPDGQNFGSYGIVPMGFIDDLCSSPASGGCTALDDYRAHGTMMAGLVGTNDNDFGYVGIAPFALTYSMKVMWNTHIEGHCGFWPDNDESMCLESDDFVRAVDYAAAQRFDVLSMSFQHDGNSDVYRALATARNFYDVFLVAATGNTAGAAARAPASYDVVMGVGGVDAAGATLFSTAARDVSGYAGGTTTAAFCFVYQYCDAGTAPGRFLDAQHADHEQGWGTSPATAIVAGIVALIRSHHPNETVSQVWERLVNTAEGPNRVVNAYAAITYQRPLSVSISGQANPHGNSYPTWTASAAGGTPPYSYAWYRGGSLVGSGSSYSSYVNNYDSFQLQVNVTDAAGATATSWLWVSAYNSCPECSSTT